MSQPQAKQTANDHGSDINDCSDWKMHQKTLAQSVIGDNPGVPDTSMALPLAWGLAAYFVMQILLNLRLRFIPRNAPNRQASLLSAAFGNGVANSIFFMVLACWLILAGLVPRPVLPQPLWLWLPGSILAGTVLWAIQIRTRGIGQRLFGGSAFVQPAEYLLRQPADLAQLNRAAIYISLLQPLSHELFFRACFLSLMHAVFGFWPAIISTATIELLLRLNPAWALSIIVSSVLLSGIALGSGGPLTTICMALSAGFLHAYVTAYHAMRKRDSSAG